MTNPNSPGTSPRSDGRGNAINLLSRPQFSDLVQINLHRSKAATASLCSMRDRVVLQKTNKNQHKPHSFIALIQEPYYFRNAIRGLGSHNLLFVAPNHNDDEPSRACVWTSGNVEAEMLVQFSDRDQVVIKTIWGDKTIVLASSYMAGDSTEAPPPDILRRLVSY